MHYCVFSGCSTFCRQVYPPIFTVVDIYCMLKVESKNNQNHVDIFCYRHILQTLLQLNKNVEMLKLITLGSMCLLFKCCNSQMNKLSILYHRQTHYRSLIYLEQTYTSRRSHLYRIWLKVSLNTCMYEIALNLNIAIKVLIQYLLHVKTGQYQISSVSELYDISNMCKLCN